MQIRTFVPVTVVNAGTRVQLTSDPQIVRAIRFEADRDNTGEIFIGDANVSSTRYAARLNAGESFTFESALTDASGFWIDASTNGQKVQVSYAA